MMPLINITADTDGYLDVTELMLAIAAGKRVCVSLDPQATKFVSAISADGFDDDDCPEVLEQVVGEWIDAMEVYSDERLCAETLETFINAGYEGLESDEEARPDRLIGTIDTFTGDPKVYLYLGV